MSRLRRWRLTPQHEGGAALAAALGVSPLIGQLLVNRGIEDPGQATDFLGARLDQHLRSPMLFRDMARASERLVDALGRGERIGIYGDYDVDGVSGSALLVRFLRSVGAQPEPVVHIPHRLREGYGLGATGIERLAAAGAKVMITVDCGAVSHREIALANERGMDVIVCDHHQVAETRPPALAVINPIERDAGFPFSGLCGTGVAFYLAWGTRMRLRERGGPVPDMRRLLDLVALGTLADLVPVVEENRVLVKYGLRELAASDHPGIAALKRVAGVSQLNSGAVGFRLAPRLNAGGRLADATRSLDLLTTGDVGEADRLATALDEENRARQAIEREMVDEAVAQLEAAGGVGERRSVVLASPLFHPGVVGIVASRIVERYYRPTVLIAAEEGGIGRGSGRSIAGVDLYAALAGCRDLLERFGGHRMAAGLSIRLERVPELAARFDAEIAARTAPEDFVPQVRVDCELPLRAVDGGCLGDLARLEPFGTGNPEPLFLTRNVRVRERRIVGEHHLKLVLEQGGRTIQAIGFGMSDLSVAAGDQLDVLYGVMANEWNGNVSAELRIRDLRPTGAG
ncbi:MAG TPA: single-stranded-DNA-specific exonuclease RecJ [Candidatus Dormibacteraeota bacterium]|nr:single-stranded-DNA-specific exonuclease RecJ [Candidatus Dormibacteraeota bacterium]